MRRPGVKRKPKMRFEIADAANRLASILERAAAMEVEADPFEGVDLREGWVTINGSHVLIGGDGTILQGPAHLIGTTATGPLEKLSKSEIARLNHKGGDIKDQTTAEESERELARELGLKKSPDNNPFDLHNDKIGVEVKTKMTGKEDSISINKDALARKKAFAEKHNYIRTFLLVVDKRPTGLGSSTGDTRYFVRSDYVGGTNRLSTMTEVSGIAGVRKAMGLRK